MQGGFGRSLLILGLTSLIWGVLLSILWLVEEVIELGINFILSRNYFFFTFSVFVKFYLLCIIYDPWKTTFFKNHNKIKNIKS